MSHDSENGGNSYRRVGSGPSSHYPWLARSCDQRQAAPCQSSRCRLSRTPSRTADDVTPIITVVERLDRPPEGGRDVLQRIARLAIAAPRRIIAVAVAGHGRRRDLRHPGRQEPVRRRVPGPHLGVGAAPPQLLTDKFGQGDMQLLITVTAPDGAASAGRPRGRHRHRRRSCSSSPHVAQRDLGVDRAAGGRRRAGQQGRQDRADRRRHHRRRERRAEVRPGRSSDEARSHDRDGVTVRAGGVGDGLRADQRADRSATCC